MKVPALEFQSRGGYTNDDIQFLAAPYYNTPNVARHIRASLKLITGTSDTINVGMLMNWLIKTGVHICTLTFPVSYYRRLCIHIDPR